jgi:fructokinase
MPTPDSTCNVLGIGELLWDLLPGAERLGGAPFNVVAHLRRFGCHAAYVSAVGADARGRRAVREVASLGVDTSLIEVNELPTGVVRVELDAAGVPDYEVVSSAAYEAIVPLEGRTAALGDRVDLLVFGTLAQRFDGVRAATRRLAEEAPDAPRLYDVNLRRGCWTPALVRDLLRFATVVKANQGEREVLAKELALPASSIEEFARAASEQYGLQAVCVTRGESGAALLLDGVYAEAPSPQVNVVDTVGAGDAFAAGLAKGLVEGWAIAEILAVATRLGSLVASREGAIPDWSLSDIGLVDSGFADVRPASQQPRSGKG